MKKMRVFALALLAICLVGCAKTPLAFLDANVTAEGDVTGAFSVRARINFTDFTPALVATKLQFSFTNPEGDTMTFLLAPQNETFPTGTYVLDGSINTWTSTITITSNLQKSQITLTTTNGILELTSLTTDANGLLVSIAGFFRMNFEVGGSGEGTFNTGG